MASSTPTVVTGKKKVSKKKPTKKPVLCLRQIDATTQIMSDDPHFPEVLPSKMEKLPKGFVRADETTIIKQ